MSDAQLAKARDGIGVKDAMVDAYARCAAECQATVTPGYAEIHCEGGEIRAHDLRPAGDDGGVVEAALAQRRARQAAGQARDGQQAFGAARGFLGVGVRHKTNP